jgi:hypothetical protein
MGEPDHSVPDPEFLRMDVDNYQIRPYRAEDLEGTVKCLSFLLGGTLNRNLSLFRWKYIQNPYIDVPIGVVALNHGQVVGYRGVFATKWHVPARGQSFVLLSPCDTCVHPDHRMSGLSIAMGRMMMEELQSKYKVLLNTSAGKTALPGYLKLGFIPLSKRSYFRRYSVVDRAYKTAVWGKAKQALFYSGNVKYGAFNDVLVESEARPEDMAAVYAARGSSIDRFVLWQDEEFFRWRFKNPQSRYVFYYVRRAEHIIGYLVVHVSTDFTHGTIVDFAEVNGSSAIESALEHVIANEHFGILSILDQALSEELRHRLKNLDFEPDSIAWRLLKHTADYPFLVRPARPKYQETDWVVEGLDVRNPRNWEIKGIANDGA